MQLDSSFLQVIHGKSIQSLQDVTLNFKNNNNKKKKVQWNLDYPKGLGPGSFRITEIYG